MTVLEYEVVLVSYMIVLVYDAGRFLMAVLVSDFDLFLRGRSCFSQSDNRKKGEGLFLCQSLNMKLV